MVEALPQTKILISLNLYTMEFRPNIAYVMGITVSRFLSYPRKDHLEVGKRMVKYVRGYYRVCLRFGSGKPKLDGSHIQT